MIVSIDPGDRHVGVAVRAESPNTVTVRSSIVTGTLTPFETIRYIKEMVDRIEVVIVEEFKLYPWKAQEQSWSPLETSQLIGALRLLVGDWSDKPVMATSAASNKSPAFARLKHVNWESGTTQHEKDAVAHLVYYSRLSMSAIINDITISRSKKGRIKNGS